MSAMQAIVLAAGAGTRMKSALPKVLHSICGRPMIAYTLELAALSGIKQPVVVLGPGADGIKQILPKGAKVATQKKALGTGHAVLSAKTSLSQSGNVLILYADAPLIRRTTIQKLIETHTKGGAVCTLLTAHLADPSGYGRIVRNEFGEVSGIVEDTDARAAHRSIREVNIGPIVCKVSALFEALEQIVPSSATKELYLTQVVNYFAEKGKKIRVANTQEVWETIGINSRVELSKANAIIRQRIIETHMKVGGVTIEDPQTTFIEHGVRIGQDTIIKPCTVIEAGVQVGKRCTIGPFARLRSGVTVGNDTKVGNFAELVRTDVGDRVRVSHFSYLGDSRVEDDVNIGAGTVTANYDGTQKSSTHIGKGAFIGSDTVLIAPVKVGNGAVTGAGSVVPRGKDVAARAVVVGVPARVATRSAVHKNSVAKAKSKKSTRKRLVKAA